MFKDIVEKDIRNVFINELEFAEEHDLNGRIGMAIVQDCIINSDLTVRESYANTHYDGVYGTGAVINVKKSELGYVPRTDERFDLDSRIGFIVAVADDMGVLTITWRENSYD